MHPSLATPTAIVESFIAAWNANHLEQILAHLHPQVVYHNMPLAPIHGRDAVRAYLADKVPFEWVDWKLLAVHRQVEVIAPGRNQPVLYLEDAH